MNSIQKTLAVVGLAMMGLVSFWAPYTYSGHWTLAPLVNGGNRDRYVAQGRLYAPLWAPPSAADVQSTTTASSHDWVEDAEVRLSAGMLGLWWAAIAAASAVGIVLASRGPVPQAPTTTTEPRKVTHGRARQFH